MTPFTKAKIKLDELKASTKKQITDELLALQETIDLFEYRKRKATDKKQVAVISVWFEDEFAVMFEKVQEKVK